MASRTQITRIQKLEDIKKQKDIVYPGGVSAIYDAIHNCKGDLYHLYKPIEDITELQQVDSLEAALRES